MVYTNQAIKISVSETSFFHPIFCNFCENFNCQLNLGGWGRLNFNSQLLPIKYSDFMFNMLKVCMENLFYVSVSSAGVFISNLFRFN